MDGDYQSSTRMARRATVPNGIAGRKNRGVNRRRVDGGVVRGRGQVTVTTESKLKRRVELSQLGRARERWVDRVQMICTILEVERRGADGEVGGHEGSGHG